MNRDELQPQTGPPANSHGVNADSHGGRGPFPVDEQWESLVLSLEESVKEQSPFSAVEHTRLTPEQRRELAELEDCLRLLETVRRSGSSCESSTDISPPSGIPRSTAEAGWPLAIERAAGDRIGPFHIESELGRGGHGVVFQAFDPRLGRRVALKVARPEVLLDPDRRKRFLREARAAGGLQHPNIARIYEVGEDGPLCYLAAHLCTGQNLAAWLKQSPALPPARAAAAAVAALADGAEHAHRAGIIHRDIKPSNVLLELCPGLPPAAKTSPGAASVPLGLESYIPQLTDFGLAKRLDESDDATRTGTILGTPAYMSPEQARGRVGEIGPATDVYALGAVLYELLAGAPPLRGESDPDTLRRICSDDPPPPSRIRAGIPSDLECICLKALEKDPLRRYPSAAALADDLRRFLAGQPTIARPLPAWSKAAKWSRRHPSWVALLGVSALALLGLGIGAAWYNGQLRAAAQHAEERRLSAESSERKLRLLLYAADLRIAEQAWQQGRVGYARKLLAAHVPKPGEQDVREFGWRRLWELVDQHLITFRGHGGAVYCALLTYDGNRVATCGQDGTVRLWEARTGNPLAVFRGHEGEVNVVALSPDDRYLVSGGDDGSIRLYDLDARKEIRVVRKQGGSVKAACFSNKGDLLATGGHDRTVTLWDTSTWSPIAELSVHGGTVESLAFNNAHDPQLAVGEAVVQLWDVVTRQRTRTLDGLQKNMTSVAWDPTGAYLAAGNRDGVAAVWSLTTGGAPRILNGHRGAVQSIQYSRYGRWLATASADGTVFIWDPRTGKRHQTFLGHTGKVWSVNFSLNGDSIVTASSDGTAKLCRLAESHTVVADSLWAAADDLQWRGLAFSPDNTSFVAAGSSLHQAGCQKYRASDGILQSSIPVQARMLEAGFLLGGDLLAAWNNTSTVYLKSRTTGATTSISCGLQRNDASCAFQPGGEHIVIGGAYPLPIWNVLERRQVGSLPGPPQINVGHLTFDPSGRWLAASQSNGRIRVWEFASRRLLADFSCHSAVEPIIALTTQGEVLAGDSDGIVRRWAATGDEQQPAFDAEVGKISALAISPDGFSLAVGSGSGVALWDLRSRSRLATLHDHRAACRLLFSSDGSMLLGGMTGGELALWRGANLRSATSTAPPLPTPKSDLWSSPGAAPKQAPTPRHPVLPITLSPGIDDLPTRFRRIHDWSILHGYVSGIPTFVDQETQDGLSVGSLCFRGEGVLRHDLHLGDLYAPAENVLGIHNAELHQQLATAWAARKGHAAGYSNFHQSAVRTKVACTVYTFSSSVAEVRTVPAALLGNVSTFANRLKAIQTYARSAGFAGGFPNYADDPASGKIGVVLLKASVATPGHISAEQLR